MALYRFHIDVSLIIAEFTKNILSVSSQNYRIEEIFRMIINTYKKDPVMETQYIGRFCMHYSEDGDQPAIDSQIMLNAIMLLRGSLHDLLDNYMLINKKNIDDQYPVELRYVQMKHNHLLLEFEYNDHGNISI